MSKQSILRRMAACATLAMLFGTAVAQNATGSAATGSMSGNSSATAGAMGASGTSAAAGSAGTASKVASADQKMMRDIAYSNMSEVAAGKLALEKSQSADVKAFAQKMIDDHTGAQQELQTLADSKGVRLPTEPDTKHKALAKAMSGMKGEAFDKRYMKQGGLNDHQNTHKLLMRVQDKARDQDLKAYAAKTMTVVDQHLSLAQDTAAKHGTGTAKASMSGGATSSSGGSGAGAASGGVGSSGRMGGTGAGAMGSGGSAAGAGTTGTAGPTGMPGAATGGTTGGASR